MEGRLPDDVQQYIMTLSTARDLASASMVAQRWRSATSAVVRKRLGATEWPVDEEALGARSLRAMELLVGRVGASPARDWRDEWVGLQMAKVRRSIHGQPYARQYLARMAEIREELSEHWREGGAFSPSKSVEYVRASAEWKVARGWPRDMAEGYTLLMTNFKAIIGDAFKDSSDEFGASAHLLQRAFAFRAPLEGVAPPCFNDLDGTYGLRRHDVAWAALHADAAVGVTFTTRAPLEASASPQCLTADGFCAPVINVGESDDVVYEPQDSDVVKFLSAPRDGAGFHSLVRTAETAAELQYDLPPLSKITLVAIHEPGDWAALGQQPVHRRLFTVKVTFL